MKDSETEKEVVRLIVSTLANHEEHYVLGSWECFAKARKRRRRLLFWFSASGLAASVMIGWLGFRYFNAGGVEGGSLSAVREQATLNYGVFHGNSYVGSTPRAERKSYKSALPLPMVNYAGNTVAGKSSHALSSDSVSVSGSGRVAGDSALMAGLSFHYSHGRKLSVKRYSGEDSIQNAVIRFNISNEEMLASSGSSGKGHSRKLRLGVNVSPGMTSTSTVSSFNFSGGVNADIPLTDNLRFSTGLQLEHQNAVNRTTDTPTWIPAGQSQAILTDLDLPLNITWSFLKKGKAKYYVTSGVSSVAYLSEKYINVDYSQKVVAVMNATAQSFTYEVTNVMNTSQKTEDPLNTFNFAGRINFMVGIEQHLSSTLSLHIEPFVKIPVTGLGSENMRFTTSGIACKLSF